MTRLLGGLGGIVLLIACSAWVSNHSSQKVDDCLARAERRASECDLSQPFGCIEEAITEYEECTHVGVAVARERVTRKVLERIAQRGFN